MYRIKTAKSCQIMQNALMSTSNYAKRAYVDVKLCKPCLCRRKIMQNGIQMQQIVVRDGKTYILKDLAF